MTKTNVTGLDILNDWSTIPASSSNPTADDLIDVLAEECRSWFDLGQKLETDAPDAMKALIHGKNLEAFMHDLSPVNRAPFWQKLVSGMTQSNQMQFVVSANKYMAPAICAAFGVPVGAKGVGVFPKEPA